MLKITPALLLLFSFQMASAQLSITGKVTDEKKTPIEFVRVTLQQNAAIVSSSITDSSGYYQFKNIKKGNYRLLFKFVSYRDTAVFASLKKDTIINAYFNSIRTLKEVKVLSKKPVFQREIDRLRFNVAETDLVFGNNVWDVIEKTPLVNVSSDGTIQISGTSGAIVYLNNKRKMLTGNELKNYLSSLPSDNLEAIEVITTPPSKYDAEGGAGIINILTKKNIGDGFIGNTALSTRQTAVNSQAGSIYLDNRKGSWNIFSDAYLSGRNRKPEFEKDIYYQSNTTNDLLQRSINSSNDFRILSPGINLGIDHQLNAKNVIGLLFDYTGNWHKETRDALSHDFYSHTDSINLTNNIDDKNSQTYSLNLNYQGKIDSAGKTFSIDFDVLEYRSKNNSVSLTNALTMANQQPLFVRDWFRSASPQQISNQSVKADFEWPVNKNLSFDFGAKSSFSRIDNNLVFEDRAAENVWVKDQSRSNAFKYNENINSLYGIVNRKINVKWSYQLGLRIENTIAKGWLEGIKAVDRNYTNIFPSAFLKYTPAKAQSYVLAVSSRITRPSFWDVNPFRTYTTDQAYYEGNPFLLPSKYYRQELSHTFNSKTGTYIVQLAASQLLDEFYALPYNPTANIIANKKVNYGNKYSFSTAVTYYKQLLPWWKLSSTALTGYVLSKGTYADNIPIDNKSFLLSISANQSFDISKKEGLSCTVITNNTFPVTIVNTEIGNRLETEVRVRKSLGALNITLSAQDLFKSNKDRYKVLVNELRIVDKNYYDTQSIALSLSFNFGKSSVKGKRNRDTGTEDLKQRMT